MELEDKRPLKYLESNLLKEIPFISHLFSTRMNGWSFNNEELNLGLHVGDQKKAVLKNRRKLCKELSIASEDLVSGEQIHGVQIHQVTLADLGKGSLSCESSLRGIDGLITNVPGVPLFAFYADCTPIYLVDERKEAIALLHAGWKGTVGNIVSEALQAMTNAYGSDPQNIKAWIGPRIESCCYEVGENVLSKIRELNLFKPPFVENRHISLGAINEALLKRAGVLNIEVSPYCTSCHNDLFFSYRKENGQTGRLGALLVINEI